MALSVFFSIFSEVNSATLFIAFLSLVISFLLKFFVKKYNLGPIKNAYPTLSHKMENSRKLCFQKLLDTDVFYE